RREIAGLADRGETQQSGDGDAARTLSCLPCRRGVAIDRHEAAIDQNHRTIGEAQRCHDIEAWLALRRLAVEIELVLVEEFALGAHRMKFERPRGLKAWRQRNRRAVEAGI